MSKDTCIKANTYCPVHKGIVGADCWHDSKDFSVPRTDWKQVDEINTLREQVEKLKNRLNKDSQEFTILCAKETEKVLREQLASLAEQNEKQKDALLYVMRATCLSADDNPDSPIGMLYKRVSNAYELPDLASPVLNRIKAEAYLEAAELVEAHHTWTTNVAAGKLLRTKADELGKEA